jgi:NADH-quinone oxidoreductase subunit M
LAVLTAFTVILTAGYILWAFQRVYLGAEYKGPHEEALTPSTWRERAIGVPLVVAALLFGILPYQTVFRYMTPSVDKVVTDLVDWQKRNDGNATPPATATANDGETPESEAQADVSFVGRTSSPSYGTRPHAAQLSATP